MITKKPQVSENLTETLIALKDKLDILKNRHPELTHRKVAKKLRISDSLISHVLSGKVKSKWLVRELQKIVESKS